MTMLLEIMGALFLLLVVLAILYAVYEQVSALAGAADVSEANRRFIKELENRVDRMAEESPNTVEVLQSQFESVVKRSTDLVNRVESLKHEMFTRAVETETRLDRTTESMRILQTSVQSLEKAVRKGKKK